MRADTKLVFVLVFVSVLVLLCRTRRWAAPQLLPAGNLHKTRINLMLSLCVCLCCTCAVPVFVPVLVLVLFRRTCRWAAPQPLRQLPAGDVHNHMYES